MNENLFNQCTGNTADDATSGLTEHTVRGEVLHVVFSSSDGTYSVIKLVDDQHREMTLVGPLGSVMEGQDIEASGRWETHKDYGRQLRVTAFKAILPSSEAGIRRYLASGLIPGIGKTYAKRIVDHFGSETLDVLDHYTERLREVPGIGRKRIAEIRKAWREHTAQRDIVIFLQGLGISASYCARILACYDVSAAEVVRQNPYRLAADVRGIGFLTADRIASNLGVEKTHPLRLAAGIEHVLEQLSSNGHVCFPRRGLLTEAANVLGVDENQAADGLQRSVHSGRVVQEQETDADQEPMVYLRRLYQAEMDLAEALRVLLNAPMRPCKVSPEEAGPGYERLNAEQQQAVLAAFRNAISIVTGGPGVGKTVVVGEIVALARRARLSILLAAPTGRAAKRMGETTPLEAKTIHRLLQWNPTEGVFVHGPDKPLECDLLIIDEVSMLDVMLACHLCRALKPGTRIVLVGDRDQLPSVGPGAVLHDLITCGRIPVTNLVRIYRQKAMSRIVTNAHAVNRGQMPDLRPVPSRIAADFYWIEQDDPERAAELIALMVRERIPRRFDLNPLDDVQVLAPMHRGSCGAMALNQRLQEALNPAGKRPEFAFGERRFRAGDRVMQTVNNYDKDVFNGELGRIRAVDYAKKMFTVRFDIGDVDYEWGDADQIVHAYAVTVHKSQGSEFPAVVMPLLTQHYVMLQRNLVYTGMTRARQLLVMIGTRRALGIALRNNKPMMRHTRLSSRLSAPPRSPSLL